MLDRVWFLWQMQDPEKRVNLIPTGAVPGAPGFGAPPGHGGHSGIGPELEPRQANRENLPVDMGWTGPTVKLIDTHDMLGGLGGQMCYIYA